MKHLNKDQTKTLLMSTLQKGGVSLTAVQTAVDGFMLDLAQGRALTFVDLGTLKPQGEQVILTPPKVKVKVSSTAKIVKHSKGTFRKKRLGAFQPAQMGPTVTDEAATRHFERNGYPRREAERAVYIGRTRKRVD